MMRACAGADLLRWNCAPADYVSPLLSRAGDAVIRKVRS